MVVTELTVVILSFNVKKLLLECLDSVFSDLGDRKDCQVIVVDNASSDGSAEAVEDKFGKRVHLIRSGKNTGFSAGNNLARKLARGEYVLFLNPDTRIVGNAIAKTLEFAKGLDNLGAVTCRVELPDGSLDYSCHRGFPTPWNSFCYFVGLSKLFPEVRLFAGYKATYLDLDSVHEVDCITGAFLLTKREVLEKIGWWDEDYYWNGEDIELCFRIKALGKSVWYYPKEKIIHYKGSSSGIRGNNRGEISKEVKAAAVKSGTNAMRIFYKKHYGMNPLVSLGVELLEKYRMTKI